MKELADIKASKSVLLKDIQAHVLKEANGPNDRRTDIIHPSEMAKADWCPRATFYRMTGWLQPKKNTGWVLENIFSEGHTIHAKWQKWLKDMGRLYGAWECLNCGEYYDEAFEPSHCDCGCPFWEYREVPLYSNRLPIAGHADGAVSDINVMIEIKSIGIGTLRFDEPTLLEKYTSNGVVDVDSLWKALRRPLASHVRQANVYLWLAHQMGLPYDRMVFLYEFKPNQQTKEFVIHQSEEILKPLLDKAESIRYALDNDSVPDCPTGGCKQCESFEELRDGENQAVTRGSDESKRKSPASKAGTGTEETVHPEATRRRLSGDSERSNGSERRRANGTDVPDNSVAGLRGGTASNSSGGRKVRRVRA